MSKAKHTAGPWFIDDSTDYVNGHDLDAVGIIQKEGEQWHIAAVWADLGDVKEAHANARLIAASPEMYDALRKVNNFISANMGKNYMVALLNREVPEIKELIKKIEG